MAHCYTRFTFIGGFFVGVALAVIILLINNNPSKLSALESYINGPFMGHYDKWFFTTNFKRFNVSFDLIRYANQKYLLESQFLYDRIKIACVILAQNVNNTKAASATWAKHCNSFSFLNMTNTKAIANKKENAWLTLCTHLQKLPVLVDWILIVTDDTLVVLENIRYFVAALDSKKPYYLGHPIRFWGVTYNSLQAGFLLSNATLASLKNKYVCKIQSTLLNLDYYLGKVLFSLNITTSDTRDRFGLSTFHGFNLLKLFFPGSTLLTNYYKFSVYPIKCCSCNSVTFKISASDQMFTYEYLLHQLQIFKYGHYGNIIPTTPNPDEENWKSFVKERGISHTNVDSKLYHKLWEEAMKETLNSHTLRF